MRLELPFRQAMRVHRASSPSDAMQVQRSMLVFHLSGEMCGLPVESVREVVPMAALSRPPSLPSILEGFLNLGGTAVPVLRLDRLFGLPEQPPGLYSPLVILDGHPHPMALLVDSVSDVLSVAEDALLPIHEKRSFNDCVKAEVAAGDRVIHLLSPERILLEQERQILAELQAREQERLRSVKENAA